VTGKTEESKEQRAKGQRRSSVWRLPLSPSHFVPRGFTLLELMIVISIIIILVSVALPQYQKTIMHARETMLRYDLDTMRKLIDQYAADKGKLPTSLQDLVSAGYMREVPTDPFTDQKDWQEDQGEDIYSTEGGTGLVDVHSKAAEVDPQGKPYTEY
jgi:general secretion pathway protein G